MKEATFLFSFPSTTLDPHLDVNYTAVRAGIGETLVKISENLELKPWLAEEWSSDASGQVWTFKIKENVTFQNGNKTDAEAVKASLERTIKDSEAMKTVLKIKTIEADGQTLTITTEVPFPSFPSELVNPNTAIIDVSETEFDKSPVGTGPFKVVSFEPGSKIELERNENYWDGEVKLDRANFSFNEDPNARVLALQSGDADIVWNPPVETIESLESDKSTVIDSASTVRVHRLVYNMSHDVLTDINVRKAFEALIDRDKIVETIMAGQATAARGPYMSDFPFVPDYPEKESGIEAAEKYLKAAGYTMENGKAVKDGKPLSLQLVTLSLIPTLPLIAQVLQSNAEQIGIDIEIKQVDDINSYMMENKEWDLAVSSLLTAPRGDGGYFINFTYMPEGALNAGPVNNEKLISIMNELNRTVDEEKRTTLIKDALTVIDEEMLHSFIVHPNNIVAHKDSVQNWVTSKSEYYMLTKDVDVKTK